MSDCLRSIASLEELQWRLKIANAGAQTRLIGIDGVDGIGKSTLARELAKHFGGTVVSLDEHLDRNQNAYIHHVRCDELIKVIATSQSPILIEGVCLLAVAQRCGFRLDAHVYVRRLSKNSLIWHDEEMCLAEIDAEELKRDEREMLKAAGKLIGEVDGLSEEELGLRGELIDYHARWKPVQLADVVFDIVHD